MVEISLFPNDVISFDVHEIVDTLQCTIALSISSLDEGSLVIYDVSSNRPSRYLISPSHGFLLTNETVVITIELSTNDVGLVRFLSTVEGEILLFDQVFVVADVVSGSAASAFHQVPPTEQADAIKTSLHKYSGSFYKELSVEYHFSEEFLQIFSLFSPPATTSSTIEFGDAAVHHTGCHLNMDAELGTESFHCSQITGMADDAIIHDNQRELRNTSKRSHGKQPCTNDIRRTDTKKRKKNVLELSSTNGGLRSNNHLPAALNAQSDWSALGSALIDKSTFLSKTALLDNLLSHRINLYVSEIRSKLRSKLDNMGYEVNELNIFCLLLSSGLEYIIEYLNESLSRNGLNKISMHEFRRFLGTLMLLSSFNLSTKSSWDLMEKITENKVMSNERFNEVIKNLRGFEVAMRFAAHPSSGWCDQKDKLQHFHFLEERMFERCREMFFTKHRGGCYVLDDELISSKAVDIEVKALSTRKSGKEGSIVDVFCDSFFQLILCIRLRTCSETQEGNVKELLSSLPKCHNSYNDENGALLACDRGYGKISLIKYFMDLNFKVITVCSAVGSGHPILPQSEMNKIIERKQNNINFNANEIKKQYEEWTIDDNEMVLRGPEIQIAKCNSVQHKLLHAIAYRDIFDKKRAQKVLRFFAAGFRNMENALCHWAIIDKKNSKSMFPTPFTATTCNNDDMLRIKKVLEDKLSNVNILTQCQRTVEWFTLRTFHLSATMAGLLFNNNFDNKSDSDLMQQLAKSWFNRTRSTPAMVTGAKNEHVVLQTFSKLSYVKGIFEVGLLENKTYPWMAASPDGIAVVCFHDDNNIVASVEIKTRVALDKIQQAEEIAAKYQYKLIDCEIGDDVWNECVEPEHSTQVLLQLWVMRLKAAFYIVAIPGTATSRGKIVYIVMGHLLMTYANDFFDRFLNRIGKLLIPFYNMENLNDALSALPTNLDNDTKSVISTRWPFFMALRTHALEETQNGFPPTNVFKTSFQLLYNSIKGGLDANTQQMASISPGVKVGFEQKYVLRLITAIITNAWRSMQLLQYGIDIESMTYTKTKDAVNRNGVKLKDFVFHLAIALIRSADDRMHRIDRGIAFGAFNRRNPNVLHELPFQCDESTLMERLHNVKWPLRFKIKHFNQNKDLVELRLTHSNNIRHEVKKLVQNHGKNHCSLCYHRQTTYGCSLCKVFLCKMPRKGSNNAQSCFDVWHTAIDLLEVRNKGNVESLRTAYHCSGTAVVETRTKQVGQKVLHPKHNKIKYTPGSDDADTGGKTSLIRPRRATANYGRIFRFDGKDYESYQDMVQAKRDRNRKVLQESGLLETAQRLKKYSAKQQAVRVHYNAEEKNIDDDDSDEFSEVIKPRYQVAKAKAIYGHEKVDFDRMSKESFARHNVRKDDELASTETEEDEEEE